MQKFYPSLIRNLKTAISLAILAATIGATHAQRFVKTFNSMADLVAANPNDVHTNAFVAASGLLYSYSAGSAAATNAEILKPNFFNGRWLQANGYVSTTNGLQKVSGLFNVLDFGPHTITNGTTSASAAIQAAVDKAGEKGGTVWIPPVGSYAIDSPITITSKYPVTIMSEMIGYARNTASVRGPALVITAPMSHVIKFASPTANRDDAGGGKISGLVILDKSMTNGNSLPGANTISVAAIDLEDFNRSIIEDVYVSGIKGTAVKTKFMIQSQARNILITYSGAPGKPPFHMDADDSGSPPVGTQSFEAVGLKIEACHNATYLQIDDGVVMTDIRFFGFGAEAETTIASSSTNFVYCDASYVSFISSHFNRNSAAQFVFGPNSSFCSVMNSTFRGGVYPVPAIEVYGIDNLIKGNHFASGRTADEITVVGPRNTIEVNSFVSSGAIRATSTGVATKVLGNNLIELFSTNLWWIEVVDDGKVANNFLDGLNANLPYGGGIKATGTATTVEANTVKQMSGIGIRVEANNSIVANNASYNNFGNNATQDELGDNFSSINLPENVNNNFFYKDSYLFGIGIYDPPSIPAGGSLYVTMAVTDARVGDFVDVTFSVGGELTFDGDVNGVNLILVRIINPSSAAVNLSSGTLRVKVTKAPTDPVAFSTVNAGLIGQTNQPLFLTGLGLTNIANVVSNNIVGGANVTITAGPNGQLTITAAGGDDVYINGSNVTNPDFDDNTKIAFSVSSTNVTATIVADAIGASELNASAVESELEAVLDLQDLQGAVTDAQVPDTITASLYTPITRTITAGSGLTGGGNLSSNLNFAVDWTIGTNSVTVACSDMTTALAAGANKAYWRAPFAMNIKKVKASVFTASSSGPVTIDIHESGTTILSTKITIDQSEKSSETAAAPVISDTAIANDAEITFDIDAAGTAAAGLLVQIYYTIQ